MVRQIVHPRTTFAAAGAQPPGEPAPVRQPAAGAAVLALRLIVAPFVVAAAALAGLAFAALLPICGIATICEGIAKTSWRFVRDTFSQATHIPARRI